MTIASRLDHGLSRQPRPHRVGADDNIAPALPSAAHPAGHACSAVAQVVLDVLGDCAPEVALAGNELIDHPSAQRTRGPVSRRQRMGRIPTTGQPRGPIIRFECWDSADSTQRAAASVGVGAV